MLNLTSVHHLKTQLWPYMVLTPRHVFIVDVVRVRLEKNQD